MNRFSKKKKDQSILKDLALPTLFFIVLMGMFWFGIGGISTTTQEQSLRSTQQAIVRSAVNCYAIEGQYPSSINYLEENYGLTINYDNYLVDYECFASNIMPTVVVLPKNAPGGNENADESMVVID